MCCVPDTVLSARCHLSAERHRFYQCCPSLLSTLCVLVASVLPDSLQPRGL